MEKEEREKKISRENFLIEPFFFLFLLKLYFSLTVLLYFSTFGMICMKDLYKMVCCKLRIFVLLIKLVAYFIF